MTLLKTSLPTLRFGSRWSSSKINITSELSSGRAESAAELRQPALFCSRLANALSRPAWRAPCVALLNHIHQRADIEVVSLTSSLWDRGWELYCDRRDKAWSLTDCISFLVMQDGGLTNALTAD